MGNFAFCCGRRADKNVFDDGAVGDFYELEKKELGSGAFGHVVLAKSRAVPQLSVAVKVIKLAYVDDENEIYPRFDEDELLQLHMEIQLTKQCSHRNIIEIIAAYQSRLEVHIVMEVASGGEVAQDFAERGAYSEHDAREVVAQLAQALKYIHARGIVHRDVKLENLLFADPTKHLVKLVDFGFARTYAGNKDCTRMVGTLPFMAPELFKAAQDPESSEHKKQMLGAGRQCLKGYGPKVDVWAMGVFTYLLLTGDLPFDGKWMEDFADAVALGLTGFSPNDLTPGLSQDAKSFVSDCLIHKVADRPDAAQTTKHAWMEAPAPSLPVPPKLSKVVSENLNATLRSRRMKFRGAVHNVIAQHRITHLLERSPNERQST